MSERKTTAADSTTTKCPICKAKARSDNEHFPFCSSRCKTIDLGRWVDESYKITRPIEQRDLEEGVD
ncbi:MAG: DNA gyrase inhibitor YacG [Phycisphaeraceae bacterium]